MSEPFPYEQEIEQITQRIEAETANVQKMMHSVTQNDVYALAAVTRKNLYKGILMALEFGYIKGYRRAQYEQRRAREKKGK